MTYNAGNRISALILIAALLGLTATALATPSTVSVGQRWDTHS